MCVCVCVCMCACVCVYVCMCACMCVLVFLCTCHLCTVCDTGCACLSCIQWFAVFCPHALFYMHVNLHAAFHVMVMRTDIGDGMIVTPILY